MRRRHPTGKGRAKSRHFETYFEVLNYVPVDYGFSSAWFNYLRSACTHFEQVLKRTAPDDLNADIFDSEIETHMALEKRVADEQRTNHMQVINRQETIVRGDLDRALRLRTDLEGDLYAIETMIEELQKGGDLL